MEIISDNIKVYNSFETVYLVIDNKRQVIIGDFYGDPEVLNISKNKKWCVMAGCGLILYFLREPYLEYSYDKYSDQWIEFGRDSKNTIWINSITELPENVLKIQIELENNVETWKFIKIVNDHFEYIDDFKSN